MSVHSGARKGKPGLSQNALRILQRVATWQRDAGYYATPADIVDAGGTRDWISLQGLLGRHLLRITQEGGMQVTGEGWRFLRINRGS